MKKRCCVTIIRSLLLLGVMSLLIGSSITAATQASHVSKAKGNSMGITNITEPPPIPPIDAAVPLNFKTASFGLG